LAHRSIIAFALSNAASQTFLSGFPSYPIVSSGFVDWILLFSLHYFGFIEATKIQQQNAFVKSFVLYFTIENQVLKILI